jgi:cytidylate kinase
VLADRLSFYYICSGLIYRAIAYVLVNSFGYTPEGLMSLRSDDIGQCVSSHRLQYSYDALSQERIFFDQEDITIFLKDKFIDKVTSIVSVNKQVREAVTAIQRQLGDNHNIVIDGRDVGSVVFPDAQIKFFVTASIAVRAKRWRKDQERYDNHFSLDEAIALITDRDERDKNRTIAPLIIPECAIIIDTSDLSKEKTIEKMLEYINDQSSAL